MGETVYVLMHMTVHKDEKEWRPVAVVDQEHQSIAHQWVSDGPNNDWIPLELNDISTATTDESIAIFDPKPAPGQVEQVQELVKKVEELQATNERNLDMIKKLQRRGRASLLNKKP